LWGPREQISYRKVKNFCGCDLKSGIIKAVYQTRRRIHLTIFGVFLFSQASPRFSVFYSGGFFYILTVLTCLLGDELPVFPLGPLGESVPRVVLHPSILPPSLFPSREEQPALCVFCNLSLSHSLFLHCSHGWDFFPVFSHSAQSAREEVYKYVYMYITSIPQRYGSVVFDLFFFRSDYLYFIREIFYLFSTIKAGNFVIGV
jgi:hypothetical protein